MQRLNRHDFPGATYSERVIQFGEGNFLRAFIDWQLDWLNQHQGTDAGVVVVRPRNRAVSDSLNQQDGLYTTLIRGLNEQGERVSETRLIRSLNREIQPYVQHAGLRIERHQRGVNVRRRRSRRRRWRDQDSPPCLYIPASEDHPRNAAPARHPAHQR